MKEPYIICAAIHFDDGVQREHQPKNIKSGLVVCGRRHHNCYLTVDALNHKFSDKCHEGNKKAIQGFLTSEDVFMDRKEAGRFAFQAEQIDRETDCLFSEDLY